MLEVIVYRILRLFVRIMSSIPLPVVQFMGKMLGTLPSWCDEQKNGRS